MKTILSTLAAALLFTATVEASYVRTGSGVVLKSDVTGSCITNARGITDEIDRAAMIDCGDAKMVAKTYEAEDFVSFDSGEFELNAEAVVQLDGIIHMLLTETEEPFVITVIGHTDAVGTHNDNFALSFRRAITVADYFEANGIGVGSAAGIGETMLLVNTQEEEWRNRRASVVIEYQVFTVIK